MTAGNESLMYEVNLELLGTQILIRCAHEACAREIQSYFRPCLRSAWRTPDLLVECHWEEAGKFLFRSRPEDGPPVLEGVRVGRFGEPSTTPWRSYDAPIPPLSEPPLRDRFIALHAASVASPAGGGIVVLGQRRAGKTSLALQLVNSHGGSLLTDETTFIHRRSRIVEPFPRAILQWNNGEPKLARPADEVCQRVSLEPMIIRHLVLLEASPDASAPRLVQEPRDVVLKRLLQHALRAGSSLDETMVTLAGLVKEVPAVTIFHGGYSQLLQCIPELLAGLGWPHAAAPSCV